MDTSHSLSVFCCASQNFIRRDPNTPQLPHGNLMHRDRVTVTGCDAVTEDRSEGAEEESSCRSEA